MKNKLTVLVNTCDKYEFLWADFKDLFNKVVAEKPPASKTSSKEVYLLGLDLK